MPSKAPVVDFQYFQNGTSQERHRTVAEVDNALKTVGFFQLSNHGIHHDQIEKCFEWVGFGFANGYY
jgi:isopenicillin N synthase-like dioxygenase